jgi:hypothetical protein
MRRHMLDPVGRPGVVEVVRRLCGVQAQVASSAELAVRLRRTTSRSGEVARALADGRLVKTWAMRGTLHLLTPEEGGAFLSLMASGRTWERPSWQRYFGVSPADIQALRVAARDALDGAALTREELVAAIVATPRLAHVGDALRSGWGTLLKPLAWNGDLCHGPAQGNRVTFMRPEAASQRWAGVPDPEEAAPVAILSYLRAYGPATIGAFGAWLAGGYFGTRQLRAWHDALGDRVAAVDIDGVPAFVAAEDLDELASARPTNAVRLLGGFDQYVLGPGTGDERIIPASRRRQVSKQSGWISPVAVVGGVVGGTWELGDETVSISWFPETGRVPRARLESEVERLSAILGRPLAMEITTLRP